MIGYTKLFSSILASTVWDEPNETRIVWITLLAMVNQRGIVESIVPGLAVLSRLPIEAARIALARLASPDPESRSKEHEGRRIMAVDGGWLIINHDKHRKRMSLDERREYMRLKQREYRKVRQHGVNTSGDKSQMSPMLTHTDPDTDPDPDPKAEDDVRTRRQQQKTGALSNARSKRPIYASDRFVVFDWQLEDLERVLGPHVESFDLHAFFDGLSRQSRESGLVIPKADVWPWLQARVVEEARRRGLPIASTAPSTPTNKRIAGLIKGSEAALAIRETYERDHASKATR